MYLRFRWILPLLLASITVACDPPDPDSDGDGFRSDDCDDGNADVHPGAQEICYDGLDQDCSGADRLDCDGDSHEGTQVSGDDCDDTESSSYPGAVEIAYDSIDQDCDGADLVDQDHDGVAATEAGGQDCNDQNPSVYPGADDLPYDYVDQDCSGGDVTDVDGDGHDDDSVGGDDCNDDDPAAYDGAAEVPYDGVDQDCDGLDITDADQDGYVAAEAGGDDCNDEDANAYPGASETPYDDIDQDCDGADWADIDQDGYPTPADCDDGNAAIHPDATEVPGNELDEDCDGSAGDLDADGYSAPEDCDDGDAEIHPGAEELAGNPVDENCDGYVSDQDDDGEEPLELGGYDCDDQNPAVHSLALEIVNSADDNCDGVVDERQETDDAQSITIGVPGAQVGSSVAMGDFNGDGFADLAVGAPGWVDPYGAATGAVFVAPGTEEGIGDLDLASDAYVIYGLDDGDGLGTSVAFGDVDGDGIADLIIGAPNALAGSDQSGKVYVFSGGTLNWLPRTTVENATYALSGISAGDEFGYSVAAVGDVNGDAVGDLLVGAPGVTTEAGSEAGAAYLFLGRDVQVARTAVDAAAALLGQSASDRTGVSVAGIGNVNSDQFGDFAVSAPGALGGSGRVFLLLGQADVGGLTLSSPTVTLSAESGAGLCAIAGGSDLNGDGVGDVLVGAPKPGTNTRGKVYVLFGRDSWQSTLDLSAKADGTMVGEQDGDLFGSTLLNGVIDDDGYADFFVAAPYANAKSGIIYLFRGQPGVDWGSRAASSATAFWKGTSEGQAITGAMAFSSADESGLYGLAMGSTGDETGGEAAGAAFLFNWY